MRHGERNYFTPVLDKLRERMEIVHAQNKFLTESHNL